MLPDRIKPQYHTAAQTPTIDPGQWWRLIDDKDPLTEKAHTIPEHGLTFLVQEVHVIDGAIHSIEIHKHPLLTWHDTKFLFEDFQNRFVLDPEGAQKREAEQALIMTRMQKLNKEIADAATAPLALPAPTSSPDSLAEKIDSLPVALRGNKSTQAATAAQTALQLAEARTQAMTAISKRMEAEANLLTAYQKEQVASMHAKVSKDTKAATDTLEKLHTLTLFLGEHQTVTCLRDGQSADPAEKLHFFQRMLFLDEEFAVHFLDDPFHWRNAMDMKSMFRDYPDVITRLMPQPRSVVIARIRRHARALPEGATYAALFQHIEESKWDEALMILVRDGERVFMIEADEDTANAKRLFPSRKEIDDLYKTGWKKDTHITPEDLAYSKSRKDHDERGLFYKRFLVLFWGLHVRQHVFGPFMDTDNNWFDPQTQNAHFVFVHDEEAGLDSPDQSLMNWLTQTQQTIGVGERVVVDTKFALNDYTCPAAYQGEHRIMNGTPRIQDAIVEQDGADLFVRIAMARDWGNKQPKRQKVYIRRGGTLLIDDGFMPFSDASTALLTRFIESRRDRVHYERTMPSLAHMRSILKEMESEEAVLPYSANAIRQARAATKWKPLEARTLKRAQTLAKRFDAANAFTLALSHEKGVTPLKAWSHPKTDFPAPWFVGETVCLTAQTPVSAAHRLLNGPVPDVACHDGLHAHGMMALTNTILNAQQDPGIFNNIDAMDQACDALRAKTYNGTGKTVLREDLCLPVGLALMASWNTQRPEVHVLSLRADPIARLAALGEKDAAIAWIKRLYGKPQSHIDRLDTMKSLTLEAREIKANTRLNIPADTSFIDWDRNWSGYGDLMDTPNERDVLVAGQKLLLSGLKSTTMSIFQAQAKDWSSHIEAAKTWIEQSTAFLHKEVAAYLPAHISTNGITLL